MVVLHDLLISVLHTSCVSCFTCSLNRELHVRKPCASCGVRPRTSRFSLFPLCLFYLLPVYPRLFMFLLLLVFLLQQLNELHASLMHVISCDEETLDAQGQPQWVRRGCFSQLSVVAPERLEAPPRHCSAARVRHAFEFLRKRRTPASSSTIGVSSSSCSDCSNRKAEEITAEPSQPPQEATAGATQAVSKVGMPLPGEAAAVLPTTAAAAKIACKRQGRSYGLSCPREWERNAVANPPSRPSPPPCCAFHSEELQQTLQQEKQEAAGESEGIRNSCQQQQSSSP